MIFFKRNAKPVNKIRDSETYFKYRDSLTGLMNKSFALKEYDNLKGNPSYGAVIIRLSGCKDMPMYKAEEYVKELGLLIPRICTKQAYRVAGGDFLIFTESFDECCEKLEFFLNELSDKEKRYVVAADRFDHNEDFDLFFKRIRRHAGAVEISRMVQKL